MTSGGSSTSGTRWPGSVSGMGSAGAGLTLAAAGAAGASGRGGGLPALTLPSSARTRLVGVPRVVGSGSLGALPSVDAGRLPSSPS